jgi:hypothetical protein
MSLRTILSYGILVSTGPWHVGSITTYSKEFEGRKCANRSKFSHRHSTVACRNGKLNSTIEIRYGRNGRAIVTLTDRGRLPLHRKKAWQFDTTRHVAKKLGLYRLRHGKPDRRIRWRFIKEEKPWITKRYKKHSRLSKKV